MLQTILKAGTTAPAVTGLDQHGAEISLHDFLGKKVILFFYPKDNTPTCIKEACNLRDNHQLWIDKGYVVIGVSSDGEKSHQKFIKKYALPYPLIADTNLQWLTAFGVWGKKQMFGRQYMGTHRTTFVIDEKGVIEHVIHPVKSAEHTAQLLELVGT